MVVVGDWESEYVVTRRSRKPAGPLNPKVLYE